MSQQSEKLFECVEKVNQGEDRETVALQHGYKNQKSMDTLIRKKGYTWDRSRQKYLLPDDRKDGRYAVVHITTGKAGEVQRLYDRGNLDPKAIAQQAGFHDHKEMGQFMTLHGYRWDSAIGNYQKEKEEPEEENQIVPENPLLENPTTNQDLWTFLCQKEDLLRQLMETQEASTGGTVPRYAVPGIFVTKSVHMTNFLDHLIRDYSKEKNISQRDLFQVALIEFLQKYGYQKEVEALLNKK